jgi:RNA polymerase sigma factor (sigma-70 family)
MSGGGGSTNAQAHRLRAPCRKLAGGRLAGPGRGSGSVSVKRGPTYREAHAPCIAEAVDGVRIFEPVEPTEHSESGQPTAQAPLLDLESLDALLRQSISDAEAFAAFYTKTVDEILRFFRRRVFDADLSADLTAETYAQLLRSVRKFDLSRGSSRQYLYGVAKNQYLLWQRKGVVSNRHRHALGMVELPSWESTEDTTIERLDAVRLRRRLGSAMASLTTPERDAIALRVLDGRSYREIAATLGCTEVAARVRVSRGLSRLASILDSERPT